MANEKTSFIENYKELSQKDVKGIRSRIQSLESFILSLELILEKHKQAEQELLRAINSLDLFI